mmetsp:Transcript_1577/g.6230  ORF Transcript_1577/g.6230 Transcript_1577/m.6230 type:complete len:273 (+) Transcript_1577:1161-1979(+)
MQCGQQSREFGRSLTHFGLPWRPRRHEDSRVANHKEVMDGPQVVWNSVGEVGLGMQVRRGAFWRVVVVPENRKHGENHQRHQHQHTSDDSTDRGETAIEPRFASVVTLRAQCLQLGVLDLERAAAAMQLLLLPRRRPRCADDPLPCGTQHAWVGGRHRAPSRPRAAASYTKAIRSPKRRPEAEGLRRHSCRVHHRANVDGGFGPHTRGGRWLDGRHAGRLAFGAMGAHRRRGRLGRLHPHAPPGRGPAPAPRRGGCAQASLGRQLPERSCLC